MSAGSTNTFISAFFRLKMTLANAIQEIADGDTVVAETEIRRRSDAESDRQIIELVKSLSSSELKKIGLRRLERN
jgi:hypothetical protein